MPVLVIACHRYARFPLPPKNTWMAVTKQGHDDNGENESEKRLAGAVSKPEPDSRGTSPAMTTCG